MLVTDSADTPLVDWSIQPFLFLAGNDLARYHALVVPIDRLSAQPDLDRALIIAPAHLAAAIIPWRQTNRSVHYYHMNQ